MTINEDLGLVYIAEDVTPLNNKITNMTYDDKASLVYVDFDTILQSFEVMNRNSRMYMGSNIDECLRAERIQSYLADDGWYGEMNHPTPMLKDHPLAPERIGDIDPSNTSHKIINPRVERNLLLAHIQTDPSTEAGRNMAIKIIMGLNPAFSCRAIAVLKMVNGKPVVFVRKIITYDWVLYPSHKEAHATSKPRVVSKNIKTFTESVKETIVSPCSTYQDIVTPLDEILKQIGRTDTNVQTIMESFALDMSDLKGFDNKGHVVITSDSNTIYCNMTPQSRREYCDFMRSFK